MVVMTSQAAQISNISTARMRVLLASGRVKGAYKNGKFWLIPLYRGKPMISKRKRGPAPRWSNPRKPSKTVVHVNKNAIQYNQKHNTTQKEVISVKRSSGIAPAQRRSLLELEQHSHTMDIVSDIPSYSIDSNSLSPSENSAVQKKNNVYGHEVYIPGECRVVYDPKGLSCGAKVWIETFCEVKVISWN